LRLTGIDAFDHLVKCIKKPDTCAGLVGAVTHYAAENIGARSGKLHRTLHAGGDAGLRLVTLVDHLAAGVFGKGGGVHAGA